MAHSFRRIVTGHDADGTAVIISDAPPPRVVQLREGGATFHEVWNTRESPAHINPSGGEPVEAALTLLPPKGGTRIRVVDFPPDDDKFLKLNAEEARKHFAEIGAADASTHSGPSARHAMMHRTATVDYGILLEGEIVLILDREETIVRQGDIIIQRGTNHAWSNRSGKIARIAFILVDGRYAIDLPKDR